MKDLWKNYITTRFFYYQLSIRSVTSGRHGKDKAKWREKEGSESICQHIYLWKHIKHSEHRKPKLKRSYSVNSDAITNPSLFNSHVKIKSILWWLQRLAYERQYLNKQTYRHTIHIIYIHTHTLYVYIWIYLSIYLSLYINFFLKMIPIKIKSEINKITSLKKLIMGSALT